MTPSAGRPAIFGPWFDRRSVTALEMVAMASIAIVLVLLFGAMVAARDEPSPAPAVTAAPSSHRSPDDPSMGPGFAALPVARIVPAELSGRVALTLQGIRRDRHGGGAAIMAGPDGVQRSFAVGEAVSPGIVLKALGRDFATIARSGSEERLVLSGFATGATQPGYSNAASGPIRPSSLTTGDSLKAGASINFADPSTLPTMLTAEAERTRRERSATAAAR